MELFDTHFVWFGQVLSVSGMILLVTSNRYVQVVKPQPYTDNFQNTYSKIKQTSDYECTHQMELFDTHFVWFGQVLSVSGMILLVTSNRYVQVVKPQPYPDNFENTYSKMKTNVRL